VRAVCGWAACDEECPGDGGAARLHCSFRLGGWGGAGAAPTTFGAAAGIEPSGCTACTAVTPHLCPFNAAPAHLAPCGIGSCTLCACGTASTPSIRTPAPSSSRWAGQAVGLGVVARVHGGGGEDGRGAVCQTRNVAYAALQLSLPGTPVLLPVLRISIAPLPPPGPPAPLPPPSTLTLAPARQKRAGQPAQAAAPAVRSAHDGPVPRRAPGGAVATRVCNSRAGACVCLMFWGVETGMIACVPHWRTQRGCLPSWTLQPQSVALRLRAGSCHRGGASY
jgi:hypothetical protein